MAAMAPVDPSIVLRRAPWLAAAVLILRWRRATPLDGLAIALALWASATTIGTYASASAQVGLTNYWSACLLFVAVRATVTSRALYAIVGYCFLGGCLWASNEIIQQGVKINPADSSEMARLGVEGVNTNYTAYALATGVAVAVALLLTGSSSRWVSRVVFATIPVMCYATIGTGTRGAQISIVLTLFYLLVSRPYPRITWWAAVTAVPAALLVVATGIYGDRNLLWVQNYFGRNTDNLSGRTSIWPIARHVWGENLWAGVRPGVFPMSNSMGIGAHNTVLAVGVETGLIGFVIYAAVMACSFSSLARRHSKGRRLVGLLLVAWLPIWMSGTWEVSPAAWIVIALWTRPPPEDSPSSA